MISAPPSGPQWAVMLLAGAMVLAGFYDWYTILVRPDLGTVSAVVLDLAQRYPVVPYLLGILTGHLLWPQHLSQ